MVQIGIFWQVTPHLNALGLVILITTVWNNSLIFLRFVWHNVTTAAEIEAVVQVCAAEIFIAHKYCKNIIFSNLVETSTIYPQPPNTCPLGPPIFQPVALQRGGCDSTFLWSGINWLAHDKLIANTLLIICFFSPSFDWPWRFSPGTAYPCKIFLSSSTNYNALNLTLVNAQRYANGWHYWATAGLWQTVTVSDSGKHGMTESSGELFLKTSEMVPNGLNIPMYEL